MKAKWDFTDVQVIREKLTIVRQRIETRGKSLAELLAICYDELKWPDTKRRKINFDCQLPWNAAPRKPVDATTKQSRITVFAVVTGNLNAPESLVVQQVNNVLKDADDKAVELANTNVVVHIFELRETLKMVPTIQRASGGA